MSEQEAFLLDFHREFPAATVRAFGAGRLADGRTSYELLAEDGDGAADVLDLACGDGHLTALLARRPRTSLVGLDLCAADLAIARERGLDATFVQGRAQALPLPDGSQDAVLCHLALMLMDEVEGVIAELRRVLRPGGTFGAVLGGGLRAGDAFALYMDLWRAEHRVDGVDMPALGDERTWSPGGLSELFSGWEDLAIQEQLLEFGGSLDEVWERLSLSYMPRGLSERGQQALRERFCEQAPALAHDGVIPCGIRLVHLRARRP